jgi:fatty acid desaturase
MTDEKQQTRNNAIAAAVILLVAGAALYFMPTIVLGIGAISPVLGFAAGVAIILAFFLVFWIRSRYTKR